MLGGMDAQTQAPTVTSAWGTFCQVLGFLAAFAAVAGGMVVGSRNTLAGWSFFGSLAASAFLCFTISTALHLLARIADATERMAPPRPLPYKPTGSAENWIQTGAK